MVCLLAAPRAGRSRLSPLLNSLCTNYKPFIRKLHNSAILESSDIGKCMYEHIQSDHCSGTMKDGKERSFRRCILFNFHLIVTRKINELIGIESGYNTIPHCRANLLKYQPKAEDLPSRSMRDSFTTAVIPLSLGSTQERYINHLGRLRTGRMLEELEMFGGKRL